MGGYIVGALSVYICAEGIWREPREEPEPPKRRRRAVLVDAPVWLDYFAGVHTEESDLLDRLLGRKGASTRTTAIPRARRIMGSFPATIDLTLQ
jgi:hypothetical protein